MSDDLEKNQHCYSCEHCVIARYYTLTCELTHKIVSAGDGTVCKNFREEKE